MFWELHPHNFLFAGLNLNIWTCHKGKSHCAMNHLFVGPCPQRDRDYCIGSNFWKFYVIRTSFTLDEPVSLMKVFRLFRLERIFLGVQSVNTVGRCTTSLSIGRASMSVIPCYLDKNITLKRWNQLFTIKIVISCLVPRAKHVPANIHVTQISHNCDVFNFFCLILNPECFTGSKGAKFTLLWFEFDLVS
jgi:hypothetical protein